MMDAVGVDLQVVGWCRDLNINALNHPDSPGTTSAVAWGAVVMLHPRVRAEWLRACGTEMTMLPERWP